MCSRSAVSTLDSPSLPLLFHSPSFSLCNFLPGWYLLVFRAQLKCCLFRNSLLNPAAPPQNLMTALCHHARLCVVRGEMLSCYLQEKCVPLWNSKTEGRLASSLGLRGGGYWKGPKISCSVKSRAQVKAILGLSLDALSGQPWRAQIRCPG